MADRLTKEQLFKAAQRVADNITLELRRQECGVCNLPGKLVIDHDHRLSKVRGLIHPSCNAILGFACDEVERLKGAILYLESTGSII